MKPLVSLIDPQMEILLERRHAPQPGGVGYKLAAASFADTDEGVAACGSGLIESQGRVALSEHGFAMSA